MQSIPNQCEYRPNHKSYTGGRNYENRCSCNCKRLDHVDGFDEVHPENKINNGLRPPQCNQYCPAKMKSAEHEPKYEPCLADIHLHAHISSPLSDGLLSCLIGVIVIGAHAAFTSAYLYVRRQRAWVPRLLQKGDDINLACEQSATSRRGKSPEGASLRPSPGGG